MERLAWALVAAVVVAWFWVAAGAAQPISMEPRGGFLHGAAPLLDGQGNGGAVVITVGVNPDDTGGASLFAGRAAQSFFAPWPRRARQGFGDAGAIRSSSARPWAGLYDIIGRAESPRKGYDAVQHGARIKPSKPPTEMTLAEIYAWIDATPGQPHAIGRFQFIPPTLRRVARSAGIPASARFTPEVQDTLADVLLEEAGLTAFREGFITRRAFMNNLAKIWAGLPNSTGRSHYHGYAGNKSTMTWAAFDAAMIKLFPEQQVAFGH